MNCMVRYAIACTLTPSIISGSLRTVDAMGVETHPGMSEVARTAAFVSLSLVCVQERQDIVYESRRKGDDNCGSTVGLPRRLIRLVGMSCVACSG